MRHGSLFSGIGGFDIAAEWMGWENVFHCEWNDFGQKTLKYYWPNAKSYGDIKHTDFTIYRGQIDVLSGGFPCQPYSVSGKRLGKEDDRHLWPEMLRAIREIQPRWVVGENVRGIISWGGGLVFDEVQSDLEAEGYEVLPFLLPAVAVDAPHRRDRVWFVAYTKSNRDRRILSRVESQNDCEREPEKHGKNNLQYWDNGKERNVTDTSYEGLERSKINGSTRGSRQKRNKQPAGLFCPNWSEFPTQSPICGRNNGIPGRLDGITFSKWRNESIKAYGNAVVPQVPFEIFKAIEKYDQADNLLEP